jgi:hypothetical protein
MEMAAACLCVGGGNAYVVLCCFGSYFLVGDHASRFCNVYIFRKEDRSGLQVVWLTYQNKTKN